MVAALSCIPFDFVGEKNSPESWQQATEGVFFILSNDPAPMLFDNVDVLVHTGPCTFAYLILLDLTCTL
jgi:hypothetical protein